MRYIEPFLRQDLRKKMVFLGGPRQVGKTTVAKNILANTVSGQYFNWDADDDRDVMLQQKWKDSDSLLVFDELHKFRRWKNWIKGIYDTQNHLHSFFVTGSARLDVYKKGGDSLLGRYHYWRLHPFTLDELPEGVSFADGFQRLLAIGGFPEPFLANNEVDARRWRKERLDHILREDIRDLESVKSISDIQLLVSLLRKRVSGSIVISHLAHDLQVASQTVLHWIEILERMYLCFVIKPYTTKIARSIQKPPKIYFFDTADVQGDDGVRFENMVATHLLKRLHFLEDRTGFRYELRYLRDKEGREVDFVILKEGEIEELIEVKWADEGVSSSLRYYTKKLTPPKSTQIVAHLKRGYSSEGIEVLSMEEFCKQWKWV